MNPINPTETLCVRLPHDLAELALVEGQSDQEEGAEERQEAGGPRALLGLGFRAMGLGFRI